MKATIKWVEEVRFLGESETGHGVVMDGPEEFGGQNQGMRPMELLLIGMGGCTAFDVVHVLRRGRHDITGCVVQLAAERAQTPPKVFTHIHAHFIVTGRGLPEAQVKRAINLSAEKLCSASIMLGKTAEITHDYEIIEAGAS